MSVIGLMMGCELLLNKLGQPLTLRRRLRRSMASTALVYLGSILLPDLRDYR